MGDASVAGHLYRIAQEAVNNALKHSQAGEVVIGLHREGATLRLRVSDDGRGLPGTSDPGLGLRAMRHRAGVIGAELAVESTPGKGVRVACTLHTPS